MHKVLTIPMSQIRPNSVGLRKVDTETTKYREIFESIPLFGIINPPNAVFRTLQAKDDEGEPLSDEDGPIMEEFYELCDGLHRYTACMEHGMEEMAINSLDPDMVSTETEVLMAQIIGNSAKVDTRPIEYSRQLIRILQLNPTMTKGELAARMGQSPDFIQGRLNLQKIENDAIQQRVDCGDINLANAAALATLPADKQLDFLEQALIEPAAAFTGIVKEYRKELSDAARQGRAANDDFKGVKPRIRKVSLIVETIEDPTVVLEEVAGLTEPADIVKATLKWAASMDSKSEETARAKHEAQVVARKETARRRELDKEARNAEKTQKKADKAKADAEAAQKLADEAAGTPAPVSETPEG